MICLNFLTLYCLLFGTLLSFSLICCIICLGKIFQSSVRWASKKAGGSSKNRKGHAPGKRRGLKAQDGERVTVNSILLRQLGVRCHPGLNVRSFFIMSLAN